MRCERCGFEYQGNICLQCVWSMNWGDVHAGNGQARRIERAYEVGTPINIDKAAGTGVFQGSSKNPYETTLVSCTCFDYMQRLKRGRAMPCKHIYRLAMECNVLGHDPEKMRACTTPLKRKELADKPPDVNQQVLRNMDPNSPLFNLTIAFTGTLVSFTRKDAFAMTLINGGMPQNTVSRETDILVIGSREASNLRAGKKSLKLRQAETLRSEGTGIKIIPEIEFLKIIDNEDDEGAYI